MVLSKDILLNIHASAHQVAIEAARKDVVPALEYTDTYRTVMDFLVQIYKEDKDKLDEE